MLNLLLLKRLSTMAAVSYWAGKTVFVNGKIGGGILTFAPSAALDIYSSVERDMAGDMRFNRNKFLIASAKSQSGNLLGMAGGALAAAGAGVFAIAIVGVTLTAAPLIIIGLIGGVGIQMIWGASGGADWAGSAAEHALKP